MSAKRNMTNLLGRWRWFQVSWWFYQNYCRNGCFVESLIGWFDIVKSCWHIGLCLKRITKVEIGWKLNNSQQITSSILTTNWRLGAQRQVFFCPSVYVSKNPEELEPELETPDSNTLKRSDIYPNRDLWICFWNRQPFVYVFIQSLLSHEEKLGA